MAVDEIAACIQMVDKQGTGEISLTDFKSAFAAKTDGERSPCPLLHGR